MNFADPPYGRVAKGQKVELEYVQTFFIIFLICRGGTLFLWSSKS